MAAKKKNQDIWDSLSEAFDPEDFKELVKHASPSARLSAYVNIIKLLTYRSKTTGEDGGMSKVDEMIEDLFTPKKKEE